jgi:iron complex outermembrane receptor protein
MHAVTKLSLLAGAAFATLALPAAGYAADAAPAASSSEVVVTANKHEEKIRNIAQSVTAITGRVLEKQQAVDFQDYVATVPGFVLVSSQPGQSRLVLRGINAGGDSSTIGTYIDEAPYGSITGLANGGVLAPDLDTFDLQRIEVLRGPQGTLYGASSLGGLLKFVTNPPSPAGFSGKLQVGVDETDAGPAGGSARGVLNVPLPDNAAIRVSGYYDDQPGFIDDPLRHANNVNAAQISGARIGLFWQPVEQLTIRLTAIGQDILSHGTATEDLNPKTLQPLYGDLTQSRTFSSPNSVAYRLYNLTANYDLNFANLTSSTSYGTLRQSTNEDATALYGPLLSGAFGTPLGAGVLEGLYQNKFTQEVRLASSAQPLEWLVGGFYTREDNALHQNLSALNLADAPAVAPGLGGLELVTLGSSYEEYAGFANIDYHFTDRFDLSFGGRYSHNDQTEAETTSGALVGGPSTVTGKSSDNVFTFAVAPKFKLSDTVTLYARVASGYRPGGPNALNPLEPAAVPRTFQPDTILDYEGGIKGDFFDHRVSADLTAFYIDWQHIQLLADVDGFGVNTNAGSARSEGLEGDVSYVPIDGLTLSANGAYTQANLTSNTPALLGGKNGDMLPYAPQWSGSVSGDYERPIAGDIDGFIGATANVTGRRKSDFDPNIGQITLPTYVSVDFRAGFEWRKYRLEAYIKNIGDARGILQIGEFGATPNGAVQAGLITPRTAGLTLTAGF